MRVVQIGSSLADWGGIERYVAYLTEGLTERGVDVVVVCPEGSYLDQRVPTRKSYTSVRAQFQFSKVPGYIRLMRELRPDIVHVHFGPDFLISSLAARKVGAKVILTRHVALPWSATKVNRYLKLFHHIIPVSHAVERHLLESGVPANRMTVAKAGTKSIDTEIDRVAIRRDLGLTPDEIAVGFFGRLVPEKGVDVLLRGLPSGVRALIFGEGPSEQDLRRLAPENAVFMGFVPNVAAAMKAVNAVVIPSVWEEAFPYSALEAMSVGKAVIGSRIGGIPELVEEGVNGSLFEASSSSSLQNVLSELPDRVNEYDLMGARGMSIFEENFTIPHMAARILDVYNSVMGSAS